MSLVSDGAVTSDAPATQAFPSGCSSSRTMPPRASGSSSCVRSWGFHCRFGCRRRGRARKSDDLSSRHRHLRSGHAAHGWSGAAARAAGARRRRHDAAADGARHRRNGRRGDEGRRLRLPDQAGRHPAAEDPARQDRRAAGDAARSEGAAPAAARARHVRVDDRQQRRDAEDLPGRRAGGADQRVGAHHRRVGHGQGAGRADDPSAQPARVVPVRRHQLRGDPRNAARERALRAREGRVHRRRRSPRRAASSWPTAARCSSTKSAR